MHQPITIPKRSPWTSQVLVLRALLRRVVVSRFGEYRLGFVWMLLEPLLGTIMVGLLLGSLVQRTVPEIPYAFFLLQGFLLLKLFTSPMRSGMNAVNANQALLVYPTVKPLDPIIARYLYDLLSVLFSMSLFVVVGMWIGVSVSLANLHLLLYCYLLTWLTGSGFGLIFGVAVAHYNEIEKIFGVIQRPLVFVSAVLIPLNALPHSTQKYLLYNPLVHTIELSRNSLFPFYDASAVNLTYPTIFSIITLAFGLVLFQNNRNFLSQR
jgi:capsular polysaccharide transport system permease protein